MYFIVRTIVLTILSENKDGIVKIVYIMNNDIAILKICSNYFFKSIAFLELRSFGFSVMDSSGL